MGIPAVTVDRSSTSRPAKPPPAGTSTLCDLPPATTVATLVGLVGVPCGGFTSRKRTWPATGATRPKIGARVTLPARLTVLARSCRLGFTVVIVVPRGASPGLSVFAPAESHATARPETAARPQRPSTTRRPTPALTATPPGPPPGITRQDP